MAELKTKKTELSVEAFLQKIADKEQQKDSHTIIELMQKATKSPPKMWGSAIIGFGDRHLIYESGRELDWFVIGLSPRKDALSLYITGAVENTKLLEKLGKHKTGKGCIYIKKLSDIDIKILTEIIEKGSKE